MAKEKAPRAEITVELSPEEYEQAALLHARRVGRLRTLPFVLGATVLLLAAGLYAVRFYQNTPFSLLPAAVFLLLSVLLPLLYFTREPAAVKKAAQTDYTAFSALLCPMTVTLYEDEALTRSAQLEMRDYYALMPQLLETKELLLLIKDSDRFLAIPKRCLPKEKEEAVGEFLRRVFIRKYRRTNRWWL